MLSVLESFAAVLLTAVPHYYEAKLMLLAWLLFDSGAEKLYRRVRSIIFQLERRWEDRVPALRRLLGDRADRIACAQLASLPASLVTAARVIPRASSLEHLQPSASKAATSSRMSVHRRLRLLRTP